VTLKCREIEYRKSLSRLATVRRHALSMLALALGAIAAVALASCGGGEDAKLLPGNTAQEITENLDRVQQYAEEGECVGAEDAVGEVTTQVEALQGVDPKLEEVLRRGAARLGEVVAGCVEETIETVAPAEESPSTEETERIPPGQEEKAEKEREKEEKDLEKEAEKAEKEAEKAEKPEKEEPPAEGPAEKEPQTTPGEDGGTGASGGVGPAAPAAPEAGGEG
jgi:chemotaxis protein histidine kinase CheA